MRRIFVLAVAMPPLMSNLMSHMSQVLAKFLGLLTFCPNWGIPVSDIASNLHEGPSSYTDKKVRYASGWVGGPVERWGGGWASGQKVCGTVNVGRLAQVCLSVEDASPKTPALGCHQNRDFLMKDV